MRATLLPYPNVPYTRAVGLLGLCTVFCTVWATSASAGTILVDDFNDLNDDGWTHVDSTVGSPWGPATIDVNGKGEYRLASSGSVPRSAPGSGFIASFWDASSAPKFSNGLLRSRIRIGERFSEASLLMRFNGSLQTGLNGYLFYLTADTTGLPPHESTGSISINLVANSQIVGSVGDLFPFHVDEDLIMEAGAVGDELSLKVWRPGETEPTEPQIVFSNETYSSGLFGVEANVDRTFVGRAGATFDDIYFTPVSVGDGGATILTTPEPGGLTAMLIGASCLALVTPRRFCNRRIPQLRLAASARQLTKQSVITCGGLLLVLVVSSAGRAQAVFDLGTFSVDDDPAAGVFPLKVPAGTYNSYRLTTDWSAETGPPFDPFSREAIWSIADGPLGEVTTTYYANPGSSPSSAPNGDSVALEWDGFLDFPITGPLDLSFLNEQTFDQSTAEWANTVLELSFESPPTPPALDADLGVVAREFNPFTLLTSGDFDTELAVYSSTGAVVGHNDDAPGPVVHSQIDFDFGLPAGSYIAALGGFNTTFEDEYSVTPGNDSGDFELDIAGSPFTGSLATGQTAYVGFQVAPIPEPSSLAMFLAGLACLVLTKRGVR